MGEVDDVQHAVDERQPDRDQRVDRAGHQPVQHGGEEDVGGEHQGRDMARGIAPTKPFRPSSLRAPIRPLSIGEEGRRDPGMLFFLPRLHAGTGKTGFASAKASGKITLMSLPCTWRLTGAAPWFWPSMKRVGP